MTEQRFVERVRELGPFSNAEDARQTSERILGILGQRLYPREAEQLGEALPAVAARPLQDNAQGLVFGLDEFFTEVAWERFAPAGISVEQAQVVCNVLAEALPPAKLEWLRQLLPELSGLLAPPSYDLRAAG